MRRKKMRPIKRLFLFATLLISASLVFAQGMMGENGYGMMGGYGFGSQDPDQLGLKRISIADAKTDVQNYLKSTRNPGLAIGEVMEFERNFYAIVKEVHPEHAAFELLVNPYNGVVTPEPGPNMMWNTKYSPMGTGFGANAGPMTVSVEQARQDAEAYLKTVGIGCSVEKRPDIFYGYYTMHILKSRKILGMLSVNGYTGRVWVHSWHGTYIKMESY
jgi:hypothetical protein